MRAIDTLTPRQKFVFAQVYSTSKARQPKKYFIALRTAQKYPI